MAKVAFLGLGVMGGPMAGHLASKGHEVTVYNRTASKAETWAAKHGGAHAPTPREAVREAEIAFACVGNDDDLRGVTLGEDGAFAGMRRGAVFVDHTTASAEVARELAGIADGHGIGFIDAPVSGGQVGAENGVLTVMCGGDAATYAKVEGVIAAYARACRLMGPAGSGQLTKMVNQICIAGLVQGLSEGIHFAKRAGLDVEAVLDVISKGAAGSWQMENRGRTMDAEVLAHPVHREAEVEPSGILLDEARRNGASLPVSALVDQFYAEIQGMGGNRWDTSSLIARLERK